MYSTTTARSEWEYVRSFALAHPGQSVRTWKGLIAHPRDAGAYASIGLPVGQEADFRFPPEHDCRGMHVQSFGAEWVVHIDQVHPTCDVGEHLRRDAPAAWVGATAALGGALGLLFARKAEGALAGALLGALFGALTALPPEQPAS